MSNLLALATELRQLNERLEGASRLEQLVVDVPADASRAEIDAAVDRACAAQGVARDAVEQIVIIKRARAPEVTAEPARDPLPVPAPIVLDFDLLRGVAGRHGIAVKEMIPGDFRVEMNGNLLLRGDRMAAEVKLREVLGEPTGA